VIGIILILLLAVHLILWFILRNMRGTIMLEPSSLGFVYLIGTAIMLGVFSLALTFAINRSVLALFDRGDLDLLVSSPLSSKTIFMTRAAGIVATVFLGFFLLAIPVVSGAIILGLPQLTGIYPTLLALVLLATSAGMLITLSLVRLFGARSARTIAQILASLVSVAFMAAYYIGIFGGFGAILTSEALQGWLERLSSGGTLRSDSLVWLPARALFLDPFALALVLLISGTIFWFTVHLAHQRFITGTQESLTVRRQVRRGSDRVKFRSGLVAVTLHKEWKLILRDPYLVSQTLLQFLYLVPLAVLIYRGDITVGAAGTPAETLFRGGLGTGVVLIGGILAGHLSRICVSGEEAPELLVSSPARSTSLRWLKLAASLAPAWFLCLPLLLLLAVQGAHGWPILLLCFVGITLCTGLINLWNAKPVPRRDLFKNEALVGRDIILSILDLVVLIGWGLTAFNLPTGSPWGIGGLATATFGTAFALWRYRQQGDDLAF
jgi:ABC-2 type transport system permease protein